MLLVEPKALLEKLNGLCTRAVERGAGACIANRHYEVTSEHLLLALIEDPESDVNAILERFHVEPSRVRSALQRMLEEQRSGHAGRPVFSPILLEWIQDAWLYSSTELGDGRVQSGALLVRLVQAPTRYLAGNLPGLDEIPRDDLRKNLALWAVQSGEAGSTPRAAAEEGGRGAAPTAAGDRSARPLRHEPHRARDEG